jgi:hypothetical protein
VNEQHRCGSCGLYYPLLVDDSELCIYCDSLHFPPHRTGGLAA